MKKFIIGTAVLGIYGIYSVGIRHINPVIAKPASLAATSTSRRSSTKSANKTSVSGSGASGKYRDGVYKGSSSYVYFGNVQVAVTIAKGRISNVKFLQFPNTHATSVYINQQAMPYLKQEAIKAQTSKVQIISGATFTSEGFIQSLQNALKKA